MVVYNNNDILMVNYKDLPNGDKGVISKAIEEFQNKCLLSYIKTRDNTIVQKIPLPRVLLHGQADTIEAEDRRFFMEVVDKSIRDAISSQNEAFLDTFHNAMKEAIHGVYTKIWKESRRDLKAPKIMSSRKQLCADRN